MTEEELQKLKDDNAALAESVRKLEEVNKALLEEKTTAKKAAEKASQEAAKKAGDIEALEKSWQEKHSAELSAITSERDSLSTMVGKLTSGTEATRLAAAIAVPGSADVLLPHIAARLVTEIKDGAPVVRVLGKDGKPSAATIEDLRKEIEADKAFAPLLVGSRASGSGSGGAQNNGGGRKTMSRADFDALDPAGRMNFAKEGGKVVDNAA